MIKQEPTHAACGCLVLLEVPDYFSEIPFAPTDENREALEKWILSYYKWSAFNTCTHQPLQPMTGKQLDIVFKTDSMPSAVHCPVPVPHHWKKAVKEGLDRDVELGIIELVPQGHQQYDVLEWFLPKEGWNKMANCGFTKAKCCNFKRNPTYSNSI